MPGPERQSSLEATLTLGQSGRFAGSPGGCGLCWGSRGLCNRQAQPNKGVASVGLRSPVGLTTPAERSPTAFNTAAPPGQTAPSQAPTACRRPSGRATVGLGGVERSRARTPGSPHSKMTRGVRVGAGPERRAGVRPAGQANCPRARVIKPGRLGGPSELLETRRCWLQGGEWRGRGAPARGVAWMRTPRGHWEGHRRSTAKMPPPSTSAS